MQVVLDVYFCVTHLTLGIVTQNRSSLALLIPGFFGILAGLLFGLRYAAIIRVHSYRPTPAPAAIPTTAAISDNAAMPSIGSGVTTPLLAGNRTTQNVSDANAAPSLAAFRTLYSTDIISANAGHNSLCNRCSLIHWRHNAIRLVPAAPYSCILVLA